MISFPLPKNPEKAITIPFNKWEYRGCEVKAAQLGKGRGSFQT